MINLSQETEALIQAKAARTGRTADEILREPLIRTGDVLTWRSSVEPPPAGLRHLHRYVAEFDFRYNKRSALGVEDAGRGQQWRFLVSLVSD